MKSKQSYILNRSITTMLIAVMLLFVAAVFGTHNTYAATGDVMTDSDGKKMEGTYKGLDWKVVEKADGTGELQLGKAGGGSGSGNSFSTPATTWDSTQGSESVGEGHETGHSQDPEVYAKANAAYEAAVKAYPWNNYPDAITSVKVVADIKLSGNASYMFAGLSNVTEFIDLNIIDTKKVTSTAKMFGWVKFDATRNPTYFDMCGNKAKKIDISAWDLSSVLQMDEMFGYCSELETVDMSQVKAQPKTLTRMFHYCSSLKEFKVGSGFDTSNCDTFCQMFQYCASLENLDLRWMSTESAYNIGLMFYACTNLKDIQGLDGFDTGNAIAMQGMFSGCENLRNIGEDVKNWDTGKCRMISSMFANCYSMTGSIDLSGWDVGYVSAFNHLFYNSGFSSINVSGWDTSNGTNMNNMFGFTAEKPSKLTEIIGLNSFDTSKVTNMGWMFNRSNLPLSVLKPVEKWDTRNVTDMCAMFGRTLTVQDGEDGDLDLSAWDVSKVEDMMYMFYQTGLENINISGWDTGSVKTMELMFPNSSKLKHIEGLEDLDTSNVTNMRRMFMNCIALEDTAALGLDVSSIKDATEMLRNANKLVPTLEAMKAEAEAVANDPAATADEKAAAAEKASNLADAITSVNKLVRGTAGNNEQGVLEDARNAYSKALMPEAVAAAEQAITAAEAAEEAAQAEGATAEDKKAAVDALKAATDAVERAQALASNTYGKTDDREAEALAKRLADGVEGAQSERVGADLSNAVESAKAVDTTGKSAASVRELNEAIENAEAIMADPEATALDKAKALDAVEEAASGLKNKSKEEKAYDTKKAEYDAAAAEAAEAKEKYEDALKKANELVAENPGSDEALDALKEAEAAAAEYADKTAEAKEKAYAAYETAREVQDPVINKEGRTLSGDARAEANAGEKSELVVTDSAIHNAELATEAAEEAKKKAEELAKSNPGSDEAVKAAEDALKAAEAAQKATDYAVEAATATGNQNKIDAAQAEADKADQNHAAAVDNLAAQTKAKAAIEAGKDPGSDASVAAATAAREAAEKDLAAAQAENKSLAEQLAAKEKELADEKAKDPVDQAKVDALQNEVNALKAAKEASDKKVAEKAKALEEAKKAEEAAKAAYDARNNPDVKPGDQFVFNNQKYEVLTVPANGNGTAALVKGKNAKSVTVPKTASYTEKGKTFDVTEINTKAFYKKTKKVTVGANVDTIDKQAFKGSKVATVVLKTKDLTKKSVKGALKGSKVKTVQVKVGSKKVNKKYVKKYKKIFTKKNAGKKVTVK